MVHSNKLILVLICIVLNFQGFSQFKAKEVSWTEDGNSYLKISDGNMVKVDVRTGAETVIIKRESFITEGSNSPLEFNIFNFNRDQNHLLIFTNTTKVWRYNTRGDYYILDIAKNQLRQIGKSLPARSLMFAKFSPDGKKVGYVSGHNIYVEDIATNQIKQLTTTGTRKMINGTFDWVYEEEFGARDGFRWSPDSKQIAFWQVDASKVKDYYMLNTTDSVYSQVIPVEYPKVGEPPSPVRIGIITVKDAAIKWMNVPGDPQQHYIPRMEWVPDSKEIVLQQLNRKQNESKLFICNAVTGEARNFYIEKDDAFIDIKSRWNNDDPAGWDWMKDGSRFLWVSEKDGWRHIFLIDRNGRETIVTKEAHDIASVVHIDEVNNFVYYMASPHNATQLYLYRTRLDGKGTAELLSPATLEGTHKYIVSPNGKFAKHSFSNHKTFPATEWITLPGHRPLDPAKSIVNTMRVNENTNVEYFKVTTEENITFDAWMVKPANFDSTKKYPVVFYVYAEPASSTVSDQFGMHNNFLFNGEMSIEGYFQISVDNRGTPSLRGREWRKSIYGKIGRLNISDQAMAAKKILEKPWFDKDRVAVWGWSGGGATTLNLMFQYPEIYKTGISIAAVTNLLFYDNIYNERYMGLPQENRDNYITGSPIYHAKKLEGNLLFIHGTGDDNVHYSNAEVLLNELIKYNKKFQFMAYPNRTHGISEGEGTQKHLSTTYTDFLRKYCPPGPR